MRSRARLAVVVVGLTAALVCVPATASGSWLVRGAGFGHGVGMSAYGAYGYGKHGAGYREIIDHYFRHLRIKRTDSASRVRVLLDSTSGSARFSGADRACGRRLKPGRTYVAARAGSSVSLLSADGSTLERCGSHLRASGRRPLEAGGLGAYRGALDFLARDGSLLIVNAVAVDDYARGSVPAEVPAEWPRETLKAFAVACRSIALSTDVGGRAFDVYPDTRTQVYKGTRAEASRTDRAIAATRGEVATYRGEVAQTTYFSASGGRTESRFLGGPRVPYLESVKDPYDDLSPLHRWKLRFSDSELDSRLASYAEGHVRRIEVTKRGDSPRIVTAILVGSGGKSRIAGDSLAAALGLYDRWAFFHHTG